VVDRPKPVEELKLMSWSRQIERPGQAGKPEQGLVERPKPMEQPKLMSLPKPSSCRSTHQVSRPCRKFEGIVGVNPNHLIRCRSRRGERWRVPLPLKSTTRPNIVIGYRLLSLLPYFSFRQGEHRLR